MSFTDNRFILKGSYIQGVLNNNDCNRAHFVRVTATVANTTVTLKDKDANVIGTVLIYSVGETIVVEKHPSHLLTTDQVVYATGETDEGIASSGIGTVVADVSTSLQVWFDGSDSTQFIPNNPSDSDTFTQWTDKSNFAHNANPTGGATTRPTFRTNVQNSLSVVRFDGTNDCLSINPVAWTQSLSGMGLLIVSKASVATGTKTLITSDQDDMGIYINGSNNLEVSMNTVTGATATAADTNWHIHSLNFDGSQTGNANRLVYRLDGSAESLTFTGTVAATTNASNGDFTVGCDAAAEFWNGDVAEIIMFNRTLTSGEVSGLESYLSGKWGITI